MPALANHKYFCQKLTLTEAKIRAFALIYLRHKFHVLITDAKLGSMTDEQRDCVVEYLRDFQNTISASAYCLNKQIKEL